MESATAFAPRIFPSIVVLSMALTACPSRPPPAADPVPVNQQAPPGDERTAPDSRETAALDRAEAAALELGRTLKGRVSKELVEKGPAAAVEVCTTEARMLTREIAERTGVEVGRSSLRLRQPANEPPQWVKEWLEQQGERAASSATPLNQIASIPSGSVARVIRPIPVEPVCLVCHGPAESLPTEVRTRLENAYPGDLATGYSAGDLRGALWAEVRVDPDVSGETGESGIPDSPPSTDAGDAVESDEGTDPATD